MPGSSGKKGRFIPFLRLKYALLMLIILALILVILGYLSLNIGKRAALNAISAQGRALTETLISATDIILKSDREFARLAVDKITYSISHLTSKTGKFDNLILENIKNELNAIKVAYIQDGSIAQSSQENQETIGGRNLFDNEVIQQWLDSLNLDPEAEFVYDINAADAGLFLRGYYPVDSLDGIMVVIPWQFGNYGNPRLNLYNLLNSVAQEAGVEYILLQNLDGIVFASKKIASMPKISEDPFLLNAINSDTSANRLINFQDREVLETVRQFKSDDFEGLFRVGLSLYGYRQIVSSIKKQIWLVFLALAVIGLMAFTAVLGFQNYQIMKAGLDKSQIVMQNLLNSIPGPVIAIDQNKKITHYNTSLLKLLGNANYDLSGKDYLDVIPRDEFQIMIALDNRRNLLFEQFLGPDAARLLISSAPLFDSQGRLIGALSISQDITNTKRAEESLEARRRLSEMGALAASMAHEIRNPLNAIGMSIQRLQTEFQPASNQVEYSAFMETLRHEIQRLNDLIEKFLAVARTSRLQKTSSNLTRMIQSIIELFKIQAESGKINISIKAEKEIWALCDNDAIKQVLINVIKNGIEAVNSGGNIEISTSERDGKAIISIKDNGPGIRDISLAMKPFHTTKKDGTGLGLSTASKLVSDHGGQLSIESAPGQGCTVNIVLPQQEASV